VGADSNRYQTQQTSLIGTQFIEIKPMYITSWVSNPKADLYATEVDHICIENGGGGVTRILQKDRAKRNFPETQLLFSCWIGVTSA